jgi:diguanylate cyclase (GGDEF)-like protein
MELAEVEGSVVTGSRCWCGREPVAALLSTVDNPPGLALFPRCEQHRGDSTGPGTVSSDVGAMLDLTGAGGTAGALWRELQTAVILLEMTMSDAPEGAIVTDCDGAAVYANAAWTRLTGLSLADSLGSAWLAAIDPLARTIVRRWFAPQDPVLDLEPSVTSSERATIPAVTGWRAGEPGRVQVGGRPLLGLDRRPVGHLVTLTDRLVETGFPAGEVDIDLTGAIDPVTGIADRRGLIARLRGALARQAVGTTTVALLVIDLQHIEDIDDLLDSEDGDEILSDVARRIGGSVRPEDYVARSGPHQFAVVSERVSFREVVQVAKRLLGLLDQPLDQGDEPRVLGASMGIAFPHYPADTPESLVDKAVAALELARAAGGDRFEVIIGSGPGSSDMTGRPASAVVSPAE